MANLDGRAAEERHHGAMLGECLCNGGADDAGGTNDDAVSAGKWQGHGVFCASVATVLYSLYFPGLISGTDNVDLFRCSVGESVGACRGH